MVNKKKNYCSTSIHQYCQAHPEDGDVCTSFKQDAEYTEPMCEHQDAEGFCKCLAVKIPAAEEGLRKLKEEAGYRGRRVVKVLVETKERGSDGYYVFSCPSCKETLHSNNIYCNRCGTQLNWEVEDDVE